MFDPARSRGLARWVVGTWLAIHVLLLLAAPFRDKWPWAMFHNPAGREAVVHAAARVDGGGWEPLPVDELFHYQRGRTDRTVLDEAPALRSPRGRKRQRAAFARWAVAQLAPDAGYVEVRLWRTTEHPRTGDVRQTELGTYEVGP